MSAAITESDLIRVVLADANVLYSRVLRDYLLYAADQEIIAIAWSAHILNEVTEHLREQAAGFDHAAAQRLASAMNRAFPHAEVEPTRSIGAGWRRWRCPTQTTANTKDFPTDLAVHRTTATFLKGATDKSTVAALRQLAPRPPPT